MTQTVLLNDKEIVVQTVEKINSIVHAGSFGPKGDPGATALSGLADVDLSDLTSDSLLIYDQSIEKWKADKKLESHLVNAGFF